MPGSITVTLCAASIVKLRRPGHFGFCWLGILYTDHIVCLSTTLNISWIWRGSFYIEFPIYYSSVSCFFFFLCLFYIVSVLNFIYIRFSIVCHRFYCVGMTLLKWVIYKGIVRHDFEWTFMVNWFLEYICHPSNDWGHIASDNRYLDNCERSTGRKWLWLTLIVILILSKWRLFVMSS